MLAFFVPSELRHYVKEYLSNSLSQPRNSPVNIPNEPLPLPDYQSAFQPQSVITCLVGMTSPSFCITLCLKALRSIKVLDFIE